MSSGKHMMSEKDFDQKLKSIMEQGSLQHTATEDGWNKILNELNKEDNNHTKAVPFTGATTSASFIEFRKWAAIACGLAVLLISGYWLIGNQSDDATPVQNNYTKNNAAQPSIPAGNTATTNDQIAITTNNQNNNSHKRTEYTNKHSESNTSNIAKRIDNNTTQNNAVTHTDYTSGLQKESIAQKQEEPTSFTNPQFVKEDSRTDNTPINNSNTQTPVKTLEPTTPNTTYYAQNTEGIHIHNKNIKNSSIGVNGGYNFGTLNSGYAVAINAKKQISKNMFVGGAVGLAMNNFQSSSNTAVSMPLNNAMARPTSTNQNAVNTPAITQTYHQLAYVQFNPTLGYNITPNLTFSVGGDVQRLVSNNDSRDANIIYNTSQNQSSVIPKTDIGLTSKTEFHINKNLSAGLLYREGMNNLLQSTNTDMSFLNRRYIQVQVAYSIPVKL